MVLGIFKIALRLRDQHVFMWQSVKVSNVFNTLTLKQIFWKTKTFFKKLEYLFLVETTKIENTSFPFKTALSEANVKTNRMATTKWTYHKERSFASNYFIFLKILFQFKNLLNRVDFLYQSCAAVSFDGVFSLWVSLSKNRSFCKGDFSFYMFSWKFFIF